MESLEQNFKRNQPYLKLGDQEEFTGLFIGWEKVKTRFGKDAYRFIMERGDGSRVSWDTGNSRAVVQMFPMQKGDALKIHRSGVEKDNTIYTISKINPDQITPF